MSSGSEEFQFKIVQKIMKKSIQAGMDRRMEKKGGRRGGGRKNMADAGEEELTQLTRLLLLERAIR